MSHGNQSEKPLTAGMLLSLGLMPSLPLSFVKLYLSFSISFLPTTLLPSISPLQHATSLNLNFPCCFLALHILFSRSTSSCPSLSLSLFHYQSCHLSLSPNTQIVFPVCFLKPITQTACMCGCVERCDMRMQLPCLEGLTAETLLDRPFGEGDES